MQCIALSCTVVSFVLVRVKAEHTQEAHKVQFEIVHKAQRAGLP